MNTFLNQLKLVSLSAGVLTCVAFADVVEINRTHVGYARHDGGHQCSGSGLMFHNTTYLQASDCSLNTLTYTWGGLRRGGVDFDLSNLPEDGVIESAFIRVTGTECDPYCPTQMRVGCSASNGTLTVSLLASLSSSSDVVPHPSHMETLEIPLDVTAVQEALNTSGWLAVGLGSNHGWGARVNNAPVLVVEYDPGIPCTADFNDDGIVNGGDLSLILGYWGMVSTEYDLDGDGYVTGADLTILLGFWGDCPTGE